MRGGMDTGSGRGCGEETGMSETATILVVDDLAANRELLGRRLERAGFRVLMAASGLEALEVVKCSGTSTACCSTS